MLPILRANIEPELAQCAHLIVADQAEAAAFFVNGLAPAQVAAVFRSVGIAVVPIAGGTKRPVRPAWTLQSCEPEDFAQNDSVGIMCGALSGNLVCVDLDSEQAIQMADQFLPETNWCEGRSSKANSHRYYLVTDVPAEWQSTAAGGIGGPRILHFRAAGIDLIGTGGHVVTAPATHDSGERRMWSRLGQPTELTFLQLLAAVDALAVACGDRSRLSQPTLPPSSGGQQQPVSCPEQRVRRYLTGLPPMDERERRARAYISTIEGAVSGNGGSDVTFRVARLLVNDFALDRESAWRLLCEFNFRCMPPWSDDELAHKLEDADIFDGERGGKLIARTENANSPQELADVVLSRLGVILRFWRGTWHRYVGNNYRRLPESDLRSWVAQILQTVSENAHTGKLGVRGSLVADVILNLAARCHVPSDIEVPCMLPHGGRGNWVALHDCMIDIDGWLAGNQNPLYMHTPAWFSMSCAEYGYGSGQTPCPRFWATLERAFGGDTARTNTWVEWMGYHFICGNPFHKFVALIGDGANGKSALCATLRAMLGEQAVCAISPSRFGGRFDLARLEGRIAVIADEVGSFRSIDPTTLKIIGAGGTLTVEEKNKPSRDIRVKTKLTFASNGEPDFAEDTTGMYRRMLLLRCNGEIPEGERIPGMDTPEWWLASGEMPGILVAAMDGLRRLLQRGGFLPTVASIRCLENLRQGNDPCRQYIVDHCVASDDSTVPKQEVYQGFRVWAELDGYSPIPNASQFGRVLKRVFPAVQYVKDTVGNRRIDAYRGIRHSIHGIEAPNP